LHRSTWHRAQARTARSRSGRAFLKLWGLRLPRPPLFNSQSRPPVLVIPTGASPWKSMKLRFRGARGARPAPRNREVANIRGKAAQHSPCAVALPSLRAQRSNPERQFRGTLDCFVAEPVIGPATSGRTRWLNPSCKPAQLKAMRHDG
jgi:hypothetical protein